jgi:hypothetical protein
MDRFVIAALFALALLGGYGCDGALVSSDAEDLRSCLRSSSPRCRGDAAVASADGGPASVADAGTAAPADSGTAPPAPPPPSDAGPAFTGTRFYVSRSGANTDGRSWAGAWNELDQIDWSAVSPGDRVEIEGGTYTTRLVVTRAGSATARITIARSREPGHDERVVFDYSRTSTPEYWSGYVVIQQPYVTLDGGDWTMFEMIADASCLFITDTGNDADYFELRNVKMSGFANPDNGGTTLCINSGSMSMDHVWFGTQVGAEDHIKLLTSTHSALRITNSVFTPWVSVNGSHSDLIEQCWFGCEAGDFVFHNNLVWDSGPGGHNLVFTLDARWASIDVSNNVFLDTAGVFQFSSRGSLRISNNVFYDVGVTIGGDGDFEAVNNIFVAPPENTNIVWGSTPRYSLWDPETYGYFSGDGTNVRGDPMFVDPANILGADGVPFTADDGFNLRAGSAAIDRGTTTIDATDIRGLPRVGVPDIGPYEYR